MNLSLGLTIFRPKPLGGTDTTPGGPEDALMLEDNTSALLQEDGTSDYLLESAT